MRKVFFVVGLLVLLNLKVTAQFSFHLIDNFEDGDYTSHPKWWSFGNIKMEVMENAVVEGRDLIAESCGEKSLNFSGRTDDWYIGGAGTDLGVDATRFSRFQIDVCATGEYRGRLKIELLEDDNQNYSIEQDPQKDYEPTSDDKWIVEVNIQGRGFSRVSIPFTAFRDANPGVGDDIWNPNQEDGSGGLLKLQLVAISDEQSGQVDFSIDNIILTY